MLVNEQFRKSVSFLCINKHGNGITKKQPKATAFFVKVQIDANISVTYVVTADHVVDMGRSEGGLFLKVNERGSDVKYHPIDEKSWYSHNHTDVAVARLDLDFGDLDHDAIPTDLLLTREMVETKEVGEGDDIFFAGLLSVFPGRERNQPIIRFGKISLMPREKLAIQMHPEEMEVQVDAYLVESVSWGGISGSPTFWAPSPLRHPGEIHGTPKDKPHAYLMGLVHGHCEIKATVDTTGDWEGGEVPINTGIAIVIPAQDILDLLCRNDVVSERSGLVNDT